MKIIFLDIDGPLVSHRSRHLPNNPNPRWMEFVSELPEQVDRDLLNQEPWEVKIPQFDPIAVSLVQRLLGGHAAQIVVTSSWRKMGKRNLEAILEQNGLSSRWLHLRWCTELENGQKRRVDEISLWLEEAAKKGEVVSGYAAIDDDPSILELPGSVLVPYADGFRWGDFCSTSAALGGGIAVTNFTLEKGNFIAEVSPGPLGEMVVQRYGNSPKNFDFGPVVEVPSSAPPGCIRCLKSPYQLVRLVQTDTFDREALKWVH